MVLRKRKLSVVPDNDGSQASQNSDDGDSKHVFCASLFSEGNNRTDGGSSICFMSSADFLFKIFSFFFSQVDK
jgi:hypothetical protein